MKRPGSVALLLLLTAVLGVGGCAAVTTTPAGSSGEARVPAPRGPAPGPGTGQPVDPALAERLQRVMIPLLAGMNNPLSPGQVRVGIIDDRSINAASAGGGQFLVTRGLLERANDRQLAGVLAHELAHDDLRHVARAQAVGTGLQIGMVILDQLIPGAGAVAPIAGQLIFRAYSRSEEYEADRHGAEILRRAGLPPEIMIETLTWLTETEGGSPGGFFATHPATGDRIERLQRHVRR